MSNKKVYAALVGAAALMVIGAIACSSDSTGGSGGSPSGVCQTACNNVTACNASGVTSCNTQPGCENDSRVQCMANAGNNCTALHACLGDSGAGGMGTGGTGTGGFNNGGSGGANPTGSCATVAAKCPGCTNADIKSTCELAATSNSASTCQALLDTPAFNTACP